MASTAEQSIQHTRKFSFCVLNYYFFSLNNAKEPLFVPKTRHYEKPEKWRIFFAKLRNFMVGLADKPRQDLATVLKSRLVLVVQFHIRYASG